MFKFLHTFLLLYLPLLHLSENQITDLKKDYSEVESKLTKKYGIDNRIDVQTGVITEKENIKTE